MCYPSSSAECILESFQNLLFSRKLSLCHFLLFILSGWGYTLVTQRDADEDQLMNYEFHMNGETHIIAKFALRIFCQMKRGVHFFAKLPRLHCKSLIIQTPQSFSSSHLYKTAYLH